MGRFGAMFFGDPVAASATSAAHCDWALLSWQELGRNEWVSAIREALAVGRTLPQPPAGAPGHFGLTDPDAVRRILDEAGFERVDLGEVNEPIRFGADADEAFSFVRGVGFVRGVLDGLDDTTKTRALETLRRTLAEHGSGDGVQFGSAAWLITARRV